MHYSAPTQIVVRYVITIIICKQETCQHGILYYMYSCTRTGFVLKATYTVAGLFHARQDTTDLKIIF